ncbi:exosortase C-terminal domain/associated protein EpsI [Desulfohalovibrio reitneri]|uniref:exosortase C-terminal domain/associated protein EpsI n=1 Tax=Desulfohalovibrio reitneri TaxID=1307759 RepID=UPI000552434A|nr:exosortase C-terminal domain/associated protein EpsI [Desulfohalovibrio reitneri]
MVWWRFLAVSLLVACAGAFMHLHEDVAVPLARPLEQFPASHEGWRMVGQSQLSSGEIQVLRPTDYLARRYRHEDGHTVDLFIGYFSGSEEAGGIHSPRNCMPGSGWTQLSSTPTSLDVGGEQVNLVKAVYGMGQTRDMLLYWFQMRDLTLNDEYSLKIREVLNSALHRRRDESFVRISTPVRGTKDAAWEAGTRFVRDFYPVIDGFLPE